MENFFKKVIVPMIMIRWWYTYPSEKYEFVSWGYYFQYMEKVTNVPSHQSVPVVPHKAVAEVSKIENL